MFYIKCTFYIGLRTVMLHSKPKYTAVHKQSFRTLSLSHTHTARSQITGQDCAPQKDIYKGSNDLNLGLTKVTN